MEDNEDKFTQLAKDKAKNLGKKTVKEGAHITKKGAIKMLKSILTIVISKLIIIAVLVFLPMLILLSIFSYFLESNDADMMTANGKYSVNSILGISDISELITINGTPQKGYKLAFVDDIDEKLEKVIESDKVYKEREITDTDTLKQYIKAELVTQLPNLGDGIPKSKLPNLDGVDLLYEPEESSNLLNSMDGIIMLGDSFTARLHNSGMLEDGCEYYAVSGVSPKYWLDNYTDLPDEAKGVCVLLGVNNPWEISEMKQLIDVLIKRYSGKPIYVQKVFPLGKNYTANDRNTVQTQIDEFNKEIEEYCKNQDNAFWIDTTAGYVDDYGYLITKDPEGIHIDADNQKTFASNIKSKILSTFYIII